MELALQQGPWWQLGQVFRHADTTGLQLQQLDVLCRLSSAENETDRRVLAGALVIPLQPAQVQFHLSLVGGLELTQLQVDRHEPAEPPVEEQQIEVVVLM